jgi:hypothetical protein
MVICLYSRARPTAVPAPPVLRWLRDDRNSRQFRPIQPRSLRAPPFGQAVPISRQGLAGEKLLCSRKTTQESHDPSTANQVAQGGEAASASGLAASPGRANALGQERTLVWREGDVYTAKTGERCVRIYGRSRSTRPTSETGVSRYGEERASRPNSPQQTVGRSGSLTRVDPGILTSRRRDPIMQGEQ